MSNAADYDTPVQYMTTRELRYNAVRIMQDRVNELTHEELMAENIRLGCKAVPEVKHTCPGCGEMITKDECPAEAPDFLCEPCHIQRYYYDEEWRTETDARRNA